MSVPQSLCNYNGLLYAAWKGEVGDDRLFYSSFNGTAWAPQSDDVSGRGFAVDYVLTQAGT